MFRIKNEILESLGIARNKEFYVYQPNCDTISGPYKVSDYLYNCNTGERADDVLMRLCSNEFILVTDNDTIALYHYAHNRPIPDDIYKKHIDRYYTVSYDAQSHICVDQFLYMGDIIDRLAIGSGLAFSTLEEVNAHLRGCGIDLSSVVYSEH